MTYQVDAFCPTVCHPHSAPCWSLTQKTIHKFSPAHSTWLLVGRNFHVAKQQEFSFAPVLPTSDAAMMRLYYLYAGVCCSKSEGSRSGRMPGAVDSTMACSRWLVSTNTPLILNSRSSSEYRSPSLKTASPCRGSNIWQASSVQQLGRKSIKIQDMFVEG